MNIIKIYLPVIFLTFFSSLSAFGSEILFNEMCGATSESNKPCHYVKDLNFHLEGNLYGKESFNFYSQYLDKRVNEINEYFYSYDIQAQRRHFSRNAWMYRPKEKDSNIEITFLFTETPDKKFIITTFYTLSSSTFYISTSQCPSGENDCVVDNMRNLIDEFVIKSLAQVGG